jgi:wyosine [tRNA(Phe)-imidazoG37] synthetase (radical SAM superfamily)
MIAFGPVPSRRLGRSLGINHIPPKICTYSCVYCQLGRTIKMQVNRQAFYNPQEVQREVEEKVRKAQASGETLDYLTFVPDGEPTLDINLGDEIERLRPLGIKIAVISNASLISREDVQADLAKADWVSLKVDAATEAAWRRVDRPHKALQLDAIHEGMRQFAKSYRGKLMTETMLITGINDGEDELQKIAEFLTHLKPDTAYLAIPTRPPAETWAQPPDEGVINRAYQILNGTLAHVEYLIGYEGNAFAFTGNAEEDLLSITAVHPMREDAVDEFLDRAKADWSIVRHLVAEGQVIETDYDGRRFFLRKLNSYREHES